MDESRRPADQEQQHSSPPDYKGGLLEGHENSSKSFISKSPSNSSFGFENTFRVLETQVSSGSEQNANPVVVTTLDLELDAIARLQEYKKYGKIENESKSSKLTLKSDVWVKEAGEKETCDSYLGFLNEFIRKNRRKSVNSDKISDKVEEAADETDESICSEAGEYPEFVYYISKSPAGQYRLKSKTTKISPVKVKNEEGKFGFYVSVQFMIHLKFSNI